MLIILFSITTYPPELKEHFIMNLFTVNIFIWKFMIGPYQIGTHMHSGKYSPFLQNIQRAGMPYSAILFQ